MADFLDSLLDILAKFVGGRDGSENNIVRFGLAALFWIPLVAISWQRGRTTHHLPHERILLMGFCLGLLRELFMLAVACGYFLGWFTKSELQAVFPPLEHLLSSGATVTIAGAFITYLLKNSRLGKGIIIGGLGALLICYLSTFWWWSNFVGLNPGITFGKTWCDWLFRIVASTLLFLSLSIVFFRTQGWVRNAALVALSFFFLNEFLKIVDMAFEEEFKAVLSPIRHAFYFFGIPVLGYIYLRELVEERTRLQDQVHGEQTLKSLGLMAGSVAHDVNNLLTVIFAHVELAKHHLEAKHPARQELNKILEGARGISETTHELLEFTGQRTSIKATISFTGLIEKMKPILERLVPEDISLKISVSANLEIVVDCDASQIQRLVINLVKNASEAMPVGGGVVEVRVFSEYFSKRQLYASFENDSRSNYIEGSGHFAIIEVEDSGEGMDPEMLSKVLDPFFTTKLSGRGLGLASVMGILQSHKGAMLIHSEKGKGTCFKVLFPTSDGPSSSHVVDFKKLDLPQNHSSINSDNAPRSTEDVTRILAIDDNSSVLDSLENNLGILGYSVFAASSAKQAVREFIESPQDYALIILDVKMPDLNGFQIAEIFRVIRPEVPILFISGFTGETSVDIGKFGPRAEFLEKPYTHQQLSQKLESFELELDS